jgi:hypothetical protein
VELAEGRGCAAQDTVMEDRLGCRGSGRVVPRPGGRAVGGSKWAEWGRVCGVGWGQVGGARLGRVGPSGSGRGGRVDGAAAAAPGRVGPGGACLMRWVACGMEVGI